MLFGICLVVFYQNSTTTDQLGYQILEVRTNDEEAKHKNVGAAN